MTKKATKKVLNTNLHKAKTAKNDEFYSMLTDIELELTHYKKFFKDKIIFCNCDDPSWSNFWKYFYLNFKHFGLKKLISTHFDKVNSTYKLEYDGVNLVKTELTQNGDFRSPECIDLLKECDIVVTNPPFSLFREFIATIVKHDKDFIIIGNKNAITYKETFSLIKEGKVRLGKTSPKTFATVRPIEGGEPSNITESLNGLTRWFTSFDISFAKDQIELIKSYKDNEKLYQKYDNYDAINVNRLVDIPYDYDGCIGVPITFFDKTFVLSDGTVISSDVVKFRKGDDDKDLTYTDTHTHTHLTSGFLFECLGIANSARSIGVDCRTIINGKNIYNRLILRRRGM